MIDFKHPSKILLALITLVNAAVQAAPSATITTTTFAGSGCPAGTAGFVVSPNGAELDGLFKQFTILAKAPVGQQSKNCVLKITVLPPAGQQVSVLPAVYRVTSQDIADIQGQTRLGGGSIAAVNQTITGPATVNAISPTGTAWSSCGAATALDDNITLTVKPQVNKTNGGAALSQIHYRLNYQPCQSPPPSAFTMVLGGNATTGHTISGNCNVGHKIKIGAYHLSYTQSQTNKAPPFTGAEFEHHCGGTHTIPTPAQTTTYVWAVPLPPSGIFGNLVFSNTAPPPMPQNIFVPGKWTITGEQVEQTPQNPSWPKTIAPAQTITILP
jgi:hypothetical protein